MAEGNNEEVIPLVERIRDGHKVTFNFRFHSLGDINSTLDPLQYRTPCTITPTSWQIVLTCKPMPRGDGFYIFSLKLKRIDHPTKIVKVSILTSFFDASGFEVISPISSSRRITHTGEVEDSVFNIAPEKITATVAVKVIMKIEHCHEDTEWHRSPPTLRL